MDTGPSGANTAETYLTETETAALLKLSRRTLQRWRQEGGGIPFRRFGRHVRYSGSDIERWAAAQAATCTSSPRAA